ncbi:MAG TPA: nickel-responsive transcriptional regulator NikR [Planctomycetota bacterium]|nr:nickel-responsive transcriptional regulator NikR [Planctomycetota bacterium]
MARAVRFTVSLEPELLVQLDEFLRQRGYTNRSQGIRNIVRGRFVQDEWERGDQPTAATVSLVYDHHQREILDRLASAQHEHLDKIVSSTHVHLDHDNCLEVLILRGKAGELREFGNRLIATRGVLHGAMTFSTTRAELAPGHSHHGDDDHGHGHDEPRARRPRKRSRRVEARPARKVTPRPS